jgi:flagellin-like hook-associated protein FlgL
MRKYVNNLQQNFYRKNKTEGKIIANRKFMRASQSPLEAAKALKVRKAISETETYQKNLDTVAGIYDSAEGAVQQISSILQTLTEKLVQGSTGTYTTYPDKQIIGEEIEQLAKQMIALMNLDAAGRKIFGGVNNSTGLPPYDYRGGQVIYNGVNVNDFNDPTMFPFSGQSFLDVGLGLTFLNEYKIDPQTGISTTFNGAEMLGSGMRNMFKIELPPEGVTQTLDIEYHDGTSLLSISVTLDGDLSMADNLTALRAQLPGLNLTTLGSSSVIVRADEMHTLNIASDDAEIHRFPKNIIQLTFDAANAVRSGNNAYSSMYLDLIAESQSFLSLSIARIGAQQAFIEFNQERLQNNMLSLKERQNLLEHPDMGIEITNQKVLEMIYNATLQMSAQTIPMSIFNFMR